MKKIFITILFLLTVFFPFEVALAAIGLDSTAAWLANGSAASPFTGASYNNVAGTTCIVGTFFNTWPSPITGVTYGGQSMTLIASQRTNNASNEGVSLWYINSPPTGTNTVDVTFTGTRYIDTHIQCYTAAHVEVSPSYGTSYGTGTNNSPVTVNVTVVNSWVTTFIRRGSGTCDTVSAPPLRRTCGEAATSLFDSADAIGSTGNWNMPTTNVGTEQYAHVGVEVSDGAPSGAAPTYKAPQEIIIFE